MNTDKNGAAAEQPHIQQPQTDATALSVFGQASGAGNDFPVLKAFQEYLEAEQAKSRKRMLNLSIFFVVLLVVVVVTFSIIMAAVINRDQQNMSAIATRNQELSDKLLDIALRDRTPPAQPSVVNVQPAPQPVPQPQPSQESLLKPLLEKIENLSSAVAAARQQPIQPAPVVVTAAAPVPQVPVESAETIRLREELKREREAIEAVKAEREKLKAEQEKLRREKIEQHRRRLYPDYYAREDARIAAEEAAKRGVPPPSQTTAPANVKRAPEVAPEVVPPPKTAPAPLPPPEPKPIQKKEPTPPPQVVPENVKKAPAPLPAPLPAASPAPKKQEPTLESLMIKKETVAKPVDISTAKAITYFDEPDETPQPKQTAEAKKPEPVKPAPAPAPEVKKPEPPKPSPAPVPVVKKPEPPKPVPAPVPEVSKNQMNKPEAVLKSDEQKPVAENKKKASSDSVVVASEVKNSNVRESPETKHVPSTTNQTEVIKIGAKDGDGIPFYIELPAEAKK